MVRPPGARRLGPRSASSAARKRVLWPPAPPRIVPVAGLCNASLAVAPSGVELDVRRVCQLCLAGACGVGWGGGVDLPLSVGAGGAVAEAAAGRGGGWVPAAGWMETLSVKWCGEISGTSVDPLAKKQHTHLLP
ncbi:hypothetical protein E2562_019690 [Oryza meyeriana var. granulata]|uniref:Uncharacterized protein n=1 Tax=Oryza meyeriana var. granulata TaxID=110450 RepID=A0A6G1C8T9_9ORYZ|nr:hypothetical protein E2562_019690 [Oryza meyeriana var. granulata]